MAQQRRSFHLSLPTADPNSLLIRAWLETIPDEDASRRIRQLIVDGLTIGAALQRIEHKVDALSSHTRPTQAESAAPTEPLDTAEMQAALNVLLDFGQIGEL